MSGRILVTRSEPGASETAERLRRKGYMPIVEPLFAIRPLSPALPDFDALAFTSANGVRAFSRLTSRRDAPAWCVGERTAQAAREAGFDPVMSADGDGVALAHRLRSELDPDTRVLHAANAAAQGDLAATLQRAGLTAGFVAVFEAIEVPPGPELSRHLSGDPAVAAALVHSPRGGALLSKLMRHAKSRAALVVAAISQAGLADLAGLASRFEIAQAPNDDALLTALDRLLSEG